MKSYKISSVIVALALSACGGGGSSDTPNNASPPSNTTPTNVVIKSAVTGATNLLLEFETAVDDNTPANELLYKVYVSTVKNFTVNNSSLVKSGYSLDTFNVTSLEPNKTYYVLLEVIDRNNNSVFSNQKEVKTTSNGVFTLTSPLLSTGYLAKENKCVEYVGQGKTPPLSWSNVPVGTKSIVIVMEDTTMYDKAVVNPDIYTNLYLVGGAWIAQDIPVSINTLTSGFNFKPYPMVEQSRFEAIGNVPYAGGCYHSSSSDIEKYTVKAYAMNVDELALNSDGMFNYNLAGFEWNYRTKIITSSSITLYDKVDF